MKGALLQFEFILRSTLDIHVQKRSPVPKFSLKHSSATLSRMPSAVQSVYLLIVAKESNPETMDDSQHFVDLQENSNFGDHKSWLSGDDNFSPALRRVQSQLSALTSTPASITGASGNVDRVLFDNLVDLFPLVESLIVVSIPLLCILYVKCKKPKKKKNAGSDLRLC